VLLGSAGIADHDYYNMLAASNVVKPPREEACVSHTRAPSHFVGVTQRFNNTLPVGRELVRMLSRNVTLALVSQFDLSTEIWTVEAGHPSLLLPHPPV
jgi:hypothetical protein